MNRLIVIFLMCSTLSCGASQFGRGAADTLFPVSDENKLGAELSAEIEKELKLSTDAQLNAYVASLGTRTVAAAKGTVPAGIKFTFKVVDDPNTVNAFAMPGGYIYVYTGLLKKSENEAEVMAVMAHEVAHVTRRHIAQRLVATHGLQSLLSVALGENPGLVSEIATGVIANGYLLKHSRDAETDADAVGIEYTVDANYSPQGYVTFFDKLAADAAAVPAFLSTHPDPKGRANAARAYIKTHKNLPEKLTSSEYTAVSYTHLTLPTTPYV